MKFSKKGILAVGAAVMITAALGLTASASGAGAPLDTALPYEVVDVDVSGMDLGEMLEGTPAAEAAPLDTTLPYEIVDVDVSSMDLTQMLPGTPAIDAGGN